MSARVIPFPRRPAPADRLTCVACGRSVAEVRRAGDLLSVKIPCRCGGGGRQLVLPGAELE